MVYEIAADGWSLDDKRSPLLAEQKLGPIPVGVLSSDEHAKNNLPDLLARWGRRNGDEARRARTEQSFCVLKSDIAAQHYDLSFNRYRERSQEAVAHREPRDVLAELKNIEIDIQQGLTDLEDLLK